MSNIHLDLQRVSAEGKVAHTQSLNRLRAAPAPIPRRHVKTPLTVSEVLLGLEWEFEL